LIISLWSHYLRQQLELHHRSERKKAVSGKHFFGIDFQSIEIGDPCIKKYNSWYQDNKKEEVHCQSANNSCESSSFSPYFTMDVGCGWLPTKVEIASTCFQSHLLSNISKPKNQLPPRNWLKHASCSFMMKVFIKKNLQMIWLKLGSQYLTWQTFWIWHF